MKIGWSCWGFVGDGVIDSPDGGRLARSLLISTLLDKEYEVIWLQKNRDMDSSGNLLFCKDMIDYYKSKNNNERVSLCKLQYDDKFPEIDVLFLEWRWPIYGRNVLLPHQVKDEKSWTPDLQRQTELLDYYTKKTNVKIVIWDKDEKLTIGDEAHLNIQTRQIQEKNSRVTIFTQAFKTHTQIFKREILLSPCDLNKIRGTKVNEDIKHLIGYVGSQYERDEQVYKYINPFSIKHPKQVVFAGNWTKYQELTKHNLVNFPYIKFEDRVLPKDMWKIYKYCLCSLLLCKRNYADHVYVTQRIHEVAANGVIALGVIEQAGECSNQYSKNFDGSGIERFVGNENVVSDAYDLIERIEFINSLSIKKRQMILDEQIEKLQPFDINNAIITFENVVFNKIKFCKIRFLSPWLSCKENNRITINKNETFYVIDEGSWYVHYYDEGPGSKERIVWKISKYSEIVQMIKE